MRRLWISSLFLCVAATQAQDAAKLAPYYPTPETIVVKMLQLGDLKPGVYVMVAQPLELKNLDNNYDSLATQWFIVSDLGLTAFSGNDGIHVFVNSLATTDAKSAIDVRLVSRSNEVLATRRTDASGHAQFEA